MGLADSGRIPRVPPYSGPPQARASARVRGSHPPRPAVPGRSATLRPSIKAASHYPGGASTPPVWAQPRSLAATGGITVVFSSCGYLDVSVPRVSLPYRGCRAFTPGGLPHSDIPGSKATGAYPGRFAACRVLLRPREPRHPPRALTWSGAQDAVPPKRRKAPAARRPASRAAADTKISYAHISFSRFFLASQHVKELRRTNRHQGRKAASGE